MSQIFEKKSPFILFCLISLPFASLGTMARGEETSGIDIIPKPGSIKLAQGFFPLKNIQILEAKDSNPEMLALIRYLAEILQQQSANLINAKEEKNLAEKPASISLVLQKSLSRLGDEGYLLKIRPTSIILSAFKPAGLFYGIQTLRQLAFGKERIPCADIEDIPAYRWRGMLLDCCRHFMTADFVKRYIDLLAFHKMNIFHWHLTEDQGWRIEIKRYPRLTEIGAWRVENGRRYGGFYTQQEIKDIVAYAQSRYVTVVPEIEMPGHSVAALSAYPEYSCTTRPLGVETGWGVFNDVFCAGKESSFEFLQNILTEVCDLFPSPYIHIGGDECPKYYWKTCPDCQKKIKELGLKDEEALQGYFTKRIEQFLQTKGRMIIGWDEILIGGVTKTAVVQSWRGLDGAIEAAKMGNAVISSPWSPVYFYCPQVKEEVRPNYGTVNSIDKVYSFDPVPKELTKEQANYVMGGECCMWSEYTHEFEVDPQMFPRLCAFAESVWTLASKRDYSDFLRRLQTHYPRLDALGVDYYRPETQIGEWKKGQLSTSPSQVWIDVTPYITVDGIYRISLIQDVGVDNILVTRAALYRDNEEIARSESLHRSQVNMYIKYPLRVKGHTPGARYTLRISMIGVNQNNSEGSIWLRTFKDPGISIY